MIRATLTLCTLALLSFTSPEATTVTPSFATTSKSVVNLTFEQKQLAFDQHVEQVYNDAKLKQKGLSLLVFKKAYVGLQNFKERQLVDSSKNILTIVDFTKPSSQKRMWIVDVDAKKLVLHTLVAHGRNTGNVTAKTFSNEPNSYMSSLGFYLTSNTYYGKHGLSLRLKGMDEGFNSNALQRAIVVHGADYATEDFIKEYGRLGRSLGCPAVPTEVSKTVIHTIKDETVLYVHSNDKTYTSDFLNQDKAIESFASALPVFDMNVTEV
jgi:hypothetical protein